MSDSSATAHYASLLSGPEFAQWLDDEITAQLNGGLGQVEQALNEAVASANPTLVHSAPHLLQAGGKRFRPLLTLLAAQFGDPTRYEVIQAAVVMELTHLATLYHDDVMDEAELRRGTPSANNRWDNSVAILTGDFLFARASDIVADLGPEAVRIQARTFARLVEGQINETVGPGPSDDPVAFHIQVLADKTGSLIAASAHLGALLSGVDPATVEILKQFGEAIGVAFQLSDDLLDIGSESAVSGKSTGTDLREGVLTLPALMLLARPAEADDAATSRLRELLQGPIEDPQVHAEALTLLREHDVLHESYQELHRWADRARALLAQLPDGSARRMLDQVCDLVVNRSA